MENKHFTIVWSANFETNFRFTNFSKKKDFITFKMTISELILDFEKTLPNLVSHFSIATIPINYWGRIISKDPYVVKLAHTTYIENI